MSGSIMLICAYKPSETMPRLVRELLALGNERLIVVNDGSGPRFERIFASIGEEFPGRISILAHEKNRGKGAALKTGFAAARELAKTERSLTHVVCIDADGQHLPADVRKVIERSTLSPDTAYLGCRTFAARTPVRSRFGNLVTREIFSLISGQRITDTQTGLRAIPLSIIPDLLTLSGDAYEYEIQQLLWIVENGIPIHEVPIATVYFANGQSHFNPVVDSMRIYNVLLCHLMRRIL